MYLLQWYGWQVTIGFACIGVINGVFMQETLRVAQSDDAIMMRDVARKDRHVQWVPVGNFVVGCAKCNAKLLFVWPAIVIFDLVLFSLFNLIPCIYNIYKFLQPVWFWFCYFVQSSDWVISLLR